VPLAMQIGIDTLQHGLMMVLGIGLYKPPVGTISSTIAGSSMVDTTRAFWPYFSVALACWWQSATSLP
jgi:TRAP-type C4-dicarboxylate transport system permease large subunit